MIKFILEELNKILRMLESVDLNSTNRQTYNASQKNVINAYSRLFDLIKFIEREEGKEEWKI